MELESRNFTSKEPHAAREPQVADPWCRPITFKDESSDFPLASEIALRDIYMDDGISGTNDIKTDQILRSQLNDMFAKGGMNLHKWTPNSLELLNSFPSSSQERALPFDVHDSKTLSMNWLHLDDISLNNFSYI
ncbi:hypothetical protein AVEN_36346-1 [Araneus ventricosus]|uniref:Uncharacterized protein n=1 Tax=Araneus ventricosus TaxID=182803 RepID=A0A4Y2WT35_ARAVE|nr:hypothetical protein AVEN_36346-1 [Araneus ventricosus]